MNAAVLVEYTAEERAQDALYFALAMCRQLRLAIERLPINSGQAVMLAVEREGYKTLAKERVNAMRGERQYLTPFLKTMARAEGVPA